MEEKSAGRIGDDPGITQLLQQMSGGDKGAGDVVWSELLNDLKGQARRVVRGGNPGQSLQATDLIGLAYGRMVQLRGQEWRSRRQFVRYVGLAMQAAVIDYYRKRRPETVRAEMDALVSEVQAQVGDVHAFREAMENIEALDVELAEMLRLKSIGFEVGEIAGCMGVSVRTATRRLQTGRALLHKEMR